MGLIRKTFRRTVVRPAKRTVRRKVTRPAKRKAQRATSFECPTCHKRYTNPLTHVCTVKTDFRKRAAAEKRRQATEARRVKAAEQRQRAKERKAATRARQRERARVRKKTAADRRKAAAAARRQAARSRPAPRPRAPQHEYRLCRDDDCRRLACIAFREGIESCPRFHGEG